MPRPLLVPVTSTALDLRRRGRPSAAWPTAMPSPAPRNSRTNRCGSQSALGSSFDAGLGRALSACCRAWRHGHAGCGWPDGGACRESRAGRLRSRRDRPCAAAARGRGRPRSPSPGSPSPASSKICVIPTLRPSNPIAIAYSPVVMSPAGTRRRPGRAFTRASFRCIECPKCLLTESLSCCSCGRQCQL